MSDNEQQAAAPAETPVRTIIVAVALSLIASIAVSAAAVILKPTQELNKTLAKKKIILQVAGLYEDGADIDATFQSRIEPRLVDLATGQYSDATDAASYDQRKAAKDPAQSKTLSKADDIASIKRQANLASVYLVKEGDELKKMILPVHGYGLWSTLYGFVALKPDLNTVSGLQFYEHAETPGLGGEVDNPKWRGLWADKKLYDQAGDVKISVVKGVASGDHQVDALAGATLTSVGVHNLVQFWVGEKGFGPFLRNVKQ
ncbi:Na(+)-translocating NADH-quinone reductase subunit C [Terasakiella sp. A23]|uniref:Na(+)-translocating NADH-quinone reductase subunit C n=1 Tax=Terasakiella sp. FCG-A23 TaxID=3080561 RepID=UPI002952BAA6|nr:Na(+)-translocating NADH-quinone reductase subunit C [Terasakiella sp. A23]MDV7338822.1 Na(+)-translocating NADH-quinone reductase subunit C [Terasakiella sp. A23]